MKQLTQFLRKRKTMEIKHFKFLISFNLKVSLVEKKEYMHEILLNIYQTRHKDVSCMAEFGLYDQFIGFIYAC